MSSARVVAGLLAAGCAEPTSVSDAGCEPVFVGDPKSAPEIEIVEIGADGSLQPLAEGDEVTILTPLGGGKIVLVGALASNVSLESCGRLRISALLRDPTVEGAPVFKNEERHIRYEPMSGRAGWAAPIFVNDVRNMALSLEVCGFTPYARDSDGCVWILEVRLEDGGTEEILASERMNIVPTCAEDDPGLPNPGGYAIDPDLERPLCHCQCAANFEFGRCDFDALDEWVDPPQTCD